MAETMLPTVADDPDVRAARQAVADLERRLDAARAASMRPLAGTLAAPETRAQRRAREAAHDLEAQLGPARRARDLAEQQVRAQILDAEQPAARARCQTLLTRLDALLDAVGADRAAHEALAARLGAVVGAYVAPELLALGPVRARLQRVLTLPAPPGPPPVPPGKALIRALQRFTDSEGRPHWPDDGAVDTVPADDVKLLIERAWAERVEA